jgi:hypothetical protein
MGQAITVKSDRLTSGWIFLAAKESVFPKAYLTGGLKRAEAGHFASLSTRERESEN